MTAQVELPSLNPREGAVSVSICGVGGQGVVLAGVVLGQAAINTGLWACQSAAYTVAARGGFARSEAILAPVAQACPLAEDVDVIIGLAAEGWRSDRGRLRRTGLALCDEGVAGSADAAGTVVTVPFERIAAECGQLRSINLVALGVLNGVFGLVPAEEMLAAADEHLGQRPGNAVALQAGTEAGIRLRDSWQKR